MHLKTKFRHAGRESFALVATLALLAVATILLVLFVSTTTLDRSASYSYSQSVKADQIGFGGLHLIVSQLQAEMYKDAMPDTNASSSAVSVFTNVAASTILPQANATNASLPSLVKMSTNTLLFSGGANPTSSYRNGVLMATSVSSTTPSLNSRSVSTNVWNQIYLGQYPSAASAPYWVIMTRGGATSALSPTLANLKDGTIGNANYAVGRFAFAIYDEGSLLDINAAGYPSSISPGTALYNQIKGTLAGADLSQIPGITPSTFISWRNAASSQAAGTFVSYITNFASTNGFQQAYPGDSTFISRQDLIWAAQSGGEGLTTAALPYLATFTRELNAPSWAPSVTMPAGTATKYTYSSNATNLTASPFTSAAGRQNPNPLIPFVRYSTSGTVTGYNSDGTTYTYSVSKGDPVVQHRFPLDRLKWIGPNGPNAAAFNPSLTPQQQADAIQACFGLYFGTAENIGGDANWANISVWKYVGYGSGATVTTKEKISTILPAVSAVETLSDVAAESPPREPNFFELLQAGVLSGSLALTTGSSQTMVSTGENYSTLQLLRIGASMLSQVQSQAYPINIEYNQSDGSNISVVALGVANLPYLNALKFVTGLSPTDYNPGGGKHQMGVYGLIGLWNPHQQPSTTLTRPAVRLYLQGTVSAGSGWSKGESGYSNGSFGPYPSTAATMLENGTAGQFTVYGETSTMAPNTYYLPLVNALGSGVNGFLNPYPITTGDIGTAGGTAGSATTSGWTSTTSALISSSDPEYTYLNLNHLAFVAFELPDLYINLGLTGAVTTGNTAYDSDHDIVWLGNPTNALVTSGSPFQLIMKYQDPSGAWVPYDYWFGYNASASWPSSKGLRDCYFGNATSTTTPASLDSVLHSSSTHSAIMMTTDPRTMRFGSYAFSDDAPSGSFGLLSNPMIDSLWSGTTANSPAVNPITLAAPFNITGYGGGTGTGIPTEFNTLPAIIGGSFFLPADLSRNNYANTSGGAAAGSYFSAYKDPDGLQRIADSGLFSTSALLPFLQPPQTGNPYFDPNDVPNSSPPRTADRPIILNRPFSSVGELGYVFRDAPWRSLDFSSVSSLSGSALSTSADSGLLDLFTVTDSPNNVVAGRVNLNRANATVLTAILNGTQANVGDTVVNTTVSSLGNASGMATALSTYTSTKPPLVNKDQLVVAFGPYLGSGNTVNSAFNSSDEQNVKAYREAYVRALADVGQTRTWNLLIDLVAQAGKYPATATDLTQFEVEGERHYWLHVAIDRFTGKVIDRQLELIGP